MSFFSRQAGRCQKGNKHRDSACPKNQWGRNKPRISIWGKVKKMPVCPGNKTRRLGSLPGRLWGLGEVFTTTRSVKDPSLSHSLSNL